MLYYGKKNHLQHQSINNNRLCKKHVCAIQITDVFVKTLKEMYPCLCSPVNEIPIVIVKEFEQVLHGKPVWNSQGSTL